MAPNQDLCYSSTWCMEISYLVSSPSSFLFLDKCKNRDCLGDPVIKTLRFQCRGLQVWSLVGELGSHMLHGQKKKKARTVLLPSKGCICVVYNFENNNITRWTYPSECCSFKTRGCYGDWRLIPAILSSVTTFLLFWKKLQSQFTNHSEKLGSSFQWHWWL